MRSAAIALLFLASSSDARFAGAATNCPVNSLFVSNTSSTSTNPSSSLSEQHGCQFFGGTAGSSCSYNLVNGTVSASASVSGFECGAGARVMTHDTYFFNGPDTTVAWTFQAKLSLSFGGSGSIGGAINVDGTRVFGIGATSLPVTRRAGQSFDLFLQVSADTPGSPGGSSASGALSFEGLPPGYSIVSCQGFTTSAPVPVVQTTWGRVKQIYR